MSSEAGVRSSPDEVITQSGVRRWLSGSARLTTEAALLGLVFGLCVVAPWTGGGYLLLLDWVSGPSQTLNPGVYGLSGSALDAMPFRIATQLLRTVVGSQGAAWLLILAFFPLAAAGAARLAGGSRWRRLPAALLMVCNPFVMDRVRVGHVALLLGLALLPWLLGAAADARRRNARFAVRPAGWFALAIAISPHMAWLGGATLAAVALLPTPTRRDITRTLLTMATAAAVYAYGIVVWASGTKTIAVTEADLEAYSTAEGPGGLGLTVLALRGYWRAPTDVAGGALGALLAVVVLLTVLSLVATGLWLLVRRRSRIGWPLVALTVTGLLLGAGIGGPLGGLYRALFDYLPLFEAMREQHKWVALAVMGYAVGFGVAIEALATAARARPLALRLAPVGLALLPLTIAPALVWGLGGSIRTSDYPAGWQEAEQAMGPGEGQVLFLPWHGYQPFSFTDGRTVATPGEAYFSRRVLASDAVELGALRTDSTSRRTAYVDELLAGGVTDGLGSLVAPLGVEYVALATDTVDADRYGWLRSQTDLELTMSARGLELYRVVPTATGRVVSARLATVPDAVSLAEAGELGTEAVLPADAVDGAAVPSDEAPSTESGGLLRVDPVRYDVAAGPAGWVVLPEEWASGWRATLDGETIQSVPSLAGTVALPLPATATSVTYQPWRWLQPALWLSAGFLVVLLAAGVAEHRRDVRGLLHS